MKALIAKTQYFLEALFSHQFVRFLAVGGLNTAILAGIAPLIAQAIILPVTAIATFLAFRKLVFRKNSQQ
jgi:putative flippase GtrA